DQCGDQLLALEAAHPPRRPIAELPQGWIRIDAPRSTGEAVEVIPHNIRRCCIAVALIAGWCAAAAAGPDKAIRAALEDWTPAFNARDAGRVCGLFSRDLIASYQGQPERNYDALCALLTASLAD